MTSPESLDIVPEHVVDPVRRAPLRARIGTAIGDGVLAVVLNGAVVGWLAGMAWPPLPGPPPQAVSVDLVDHVPGEPGHENSSPTGALSHHGSETSDRAAPARQSEKPAAAETKTAAIPPTEQRADAPAPPAPSAPVPAPAPVQDANPPPAQTAAAVPPPPEHPDNNPQPHLVEAPLPPPSTETHAESQPAPAENRPGTPEPVATPAEPPAHPKVVTAASTDETAPEARPQPAALPVLTPEQKRQAANTAALAAMLPFGASVASEPFAAQASARGQALSDAYRGAVYANFNKAQDVIEAAKARGLKGQTVVAFMVDDHGGLASLKVAVSSGNPAVDEAALDLIRQAAPFPPPPPGAQRAFSPAIGLGLDP